MLQAKDLQLTYLELSIHFLNMKSKGCQVRKRMQFTRLLKLHFLSQKWKANSNYRNCFPSQRAEPVTHTVYIILALDVLDVEFNMTCFVNSLCNYVLYGV